MFVDPIKIRYRNIRKELNTYAPLESFSQGTFKRKCIVQTTEHSGYGRQISLKSLNKNQFEISFAVENSEIPSNGSSNKHWLKLLKTLTKRNAFS